MPDPVVHHVELCVFNAEDALNRLKKFGFHLFAKKETASCKQLVARLNSAFFLITENILRSKPESNVSRNVGTEAIRAEPMTVMCCENSPHEVDTVFNVAFSVKKSDIENLSERICNEGGQIIEVPTEITDEKGSISYCIVKSICGNVVHTLLNKDNYKGEFLPGFEIIPECDFSNDLGICCIDHVTLACDPGLSLKVISFYEKCFGMNRFPITSKDDEKNGLIVSDANVIDGMVPDGAFGLRLRAMEYWRCAETGLIYKKEGSNENSFLLVVVESLGQTNCNVEEFLRLHKEGIEHIAFRSSSIIESVSKLKKNGVVFRDPPKAYYDEIRSLSSGLDVDFKKISELGILLDNEADSADENGGGPEKQKYLMQIFSQPLFDIKTFFIEVIERSGARGLGSGNILALVRSIQEEERRNNKLSEEKKKEIIKENFRSGRDC